MRMASYELLAKASRTRAGDRTLSIRYPCGRSNRSRASRMCSWSSAARTRIGCWASRRIDFRSVSADLAVVGMGLGLATRNRTRNRVLNQYAIMFEGCAGGAVQLNFRLLVDGHGTDQIEFGQREIALRRQGLVSGTCAQFLFLPGDLEGALCQVPSFTRSLDPRSALIERVLRVAHFDANLFFQLLQPQFSLAVLELRSKLVSFRKPIAKGNIEIQSKIVVR